MPALLSVLGRAVFWPQRMVPSVERVGAWGRIAVAIVERPVLTLLGGIVIFGVLAACAAGYVAGGFASGSTGPTGSDALAGSTAIAAHYPAAQVNPTTVVLSFPASVWNDLSVVQRAEDDLARQRVFRSVSGLLDPNGTAVQPGQLAQLGNPAALAPVEPASLAAQLPAATYNAYR